MYTNLWYLWCTYLCTLVRPRSIFLYGPVFPYRWSLGLTGYIVFFTFDWRLCVRTQGIGGIRGVGIGGTSGGLFVSPRVRLNNVPSPGRCTPGGTLLFWAPGNTMVPLSAELCRLTRVCSNWAHRGGNPGAKQGGAAKRH